MMTNNLVKMHISEFEDLLTPCSYCGLPANTVFFNVMHPKKEGISLWLRQVEAKCINHLQYNDMMVQDIDEY